MRAGQLNRAEGQSHLLQRQSGEFPWYDAGLKRHPDNQRQNKGGVAGAEAPAPHHAAPGVLRLWR